MKTTPKLSLWTAISVVIGCVIGSGVFVKPGRVLEAAGSSNLAIFAWVIGGLISLAGGLTMAEISSRIPKTGGVYTYVQELFGDSWAFVTGWVQTMIYGPALSAALGLYFSSLLLQFLGMPDTYTKLIALFTVFALGVVSALSTGYGAFLSNLTSFLKLIPIFVLVIGGLSLGSEPVFHQSVPVDATKLNFGVAVLATLWAYDGWVQVSNMGGEIANPSKNLPRAFLLGITGVMVVYILVNLALFHILPVNTIVGLNEKTGAVAAQTLFGSWGGKLIGLGICVSIFGCLNSNILTMPRVAYAMSCLRSFPFHQTFSALHPTRETPVNSIALKTALASIMIVLLNPDRITDIAMFVMYLCYSAVFLGVFLLRQRDGVPAEGSYRVPLYPGMPVLASAGSLYICYSMASQQPLDALISLAVSASGLPVYFWLNRVNGRSVLQEVVVPVDEDQS